MCNANKFTFLYYVIMYVIGLKKLGVRMALKTLVYAQLEQVKNGKPKILQVFSHEIRKSNKDHGRY